MIPATLAPAATASSRPSTWLAWGFPLAMWGISRLLILVAMGLVAPALPLPPGGHAVTLDWGLFARWDSGWYEAIARSGYEFAPDGRQHSVAFFPLFPLLIRGLMHLGLPFGAAGALVANLSFMAAVVLFHRWVLGRYGARAACWTSAILAWCPYSVFGTVIYTEGLFLLLSGATLAAFDRGRYGLAALFGGLAAATRIQGVLLAPALLWAAFRERLGLRAYGAAVAAGTGLAAYVGYLAYRFEEPLAFLKAQSGWHSSIGVNGREWLNLLSFGATGPAPENGVVKAVMIVGGIALLVAGRRRLTPSVLAFGLLSMGLIVASGSFASPDRYVYGALPVTLALGLTLERRPRVGYAVMAVFALALLAYSLKMAWGLWVA